ncbi:methyltransferase [Nonomuraea sp. NPDC046802]|uniref:methyltransferase n=1 Tax=Nonomuraea sp. NPDC046802 TaxID=3154919 RepID=UPI0033E62E76
MTAESPADIPSSASAPHATSVPLAPTAKDEAAVETHSHLDVALFGPSRRVPSAPLDPSATFGFSPRDVVQDIINGVLRFAALHAFVDLEGPEHLAAADELASEELAARCGAQPALMRQLLSALHAYGIVAARGGRYRLTETGRLLLDEAEGSMRAAVTVNGSPLWWKAAGTLHETVRTGQPAALEGTSSVYERLAGDPKLAGQFDRFMSDRSAAIGRSLARLSDDYFAGVHTVVDLGGGRGGVLAPMLEARTDLRGVLVDRADVVLRAQEYLSEHGLTSRVQLVTGDIFSSCWSDAERFILSSILHNWPDEDCLRLLTLIAAAMRESGPKAQLWCIEGCKPAQEGDYNLFVDLGIRMMMMFPGGQERTEQEFRTLMAKAGLLMRETVDLPHGQTLMIAVVAEGAG